jgi:hypothetical protein
LILGRVVAFGVGFEQAKTIPLSIATIAELGQVTPTKGVSISDFAVNINSLAVSENGLLFKGSQIALEGRDIVFVCGGTMPKPGFSRQ